MAESSYVDTSDVQEIHDVLELLGTGVNCNTFSDRGRRQNVEVQRFKEAVTVQKHTEQFHRFCKDLLCHIFSCIVAAGKSMDAIKERNRIPTLSPEEDFWTPKTLGWFPRNTSLAPTRSSMDTISKQTVVQPSIGFMPKARCRADIKAYGSSCIIHLWVIGSRWREYYPLYGRLHAIQASLRIQEKDAERAAKIVDCFSEMAQSGLEDDFFFFFAYTQGWTKAISRGEYSKLVILPFYFLETGHGDEGLAVSTFGELQY